MPVDSWLYGVRHYLHKRFYAGKQVATGIIRNYSASRSNTALSQQSLVICAPFTKKLPVAITISTAAGLRLYGFTEK